MCVGCSENFFGWPLVNCDVDGFSLYHPLPNFDFIPLQESRIDAQQFARLTELLTATVEKELYYWTHVPLNPPQSVFKGDVVQRMADAFQQNTYDERDDVCKDENGKQKVPNLTSAPPPHEG